MSGFEFAILVTTFLVCLSLFWSALRVGITPVPSSAKARRKILAVSGSITSGPIIELGSGWGGLAIALARKHPNQAVIGYELSLIPWLVSVITGRLRGLKNLSFRRENFLKVNFNDSALLVCYLHPKGMKQLAEKLSAEEPAINMLISHTFALPDHQPQQIIRLDDLYNSPVYVYALQRKSDVQK